MRKPPSKKKNENKKDFRPVIKITLILFLTLFCAVQGLANGKGKDGKFQVEFFAGYSAFNPEDLNLFVDYDNTIRTFYYDSFLKYLKDTGQIYLWIKDEEGGRKKLKHAFPFGLRLKYFLNPSFALSLGIKYLSRQESHTLEYKYTQFRYNQGRFYEQIKYSPYSLSASGFSPQIGLHLVKKLSKQISLEGYVSGGLLFAQCRYLSQWQYSLRIREGSIFHPPLIREGLLEQQGKGTGFALDLGIRMNYRLSKWSGAFFTAGYSFQQVRSLSGSGREVLDQNSREWQGEWGIKQETIISPWGYLKLEFPTNYWPSRDNYFREFVLDMSGFQVRLGLFFKL